MVGVSSFDHFYAGSSVINRTSFKAEHPSENPYPAFLTRAEQTLVNR